MGKTNIGWTELTWNPVVGCTRCATGCKNCYAFALHNQRHAAYNAGKSVPQQYAKPFTEIQLLPERLDYPLHKLKPAMFFVNSMSDLFHPDVPFEFIDRVFAVMVRTPRHTYQVLTKRPQRMLEWLEWSQRFDNFEEELARQRFKATGDWDTRYEFPFPNVWLGCSCSTQDDVDRDVPIVLQCPAVVRLLSLEPLLGPLQLTLQGIDWIIVGGESGPNYRPCQPEWIESIVHQCRAACVPCFVKQDSSLRPGKQGRLSDDVWSVKEFPAITGHLC